MLLLNIHGQPIPQPRHRVAVRGRSARAYIPSKHPIHRWRESLRGALISQGASGECPYDPDHPLVALATFCIERPSGHFTPKGKLKKGTRPFPTGARDGDADNLMKPILDVMEGQGIFSNDSQVVRLFDVSKHFAAYGERPFARVCIMTHDELLAVLTGMTPAQIAGNGVLAYL